MRSMEIAVFEDLEAITFVAVFYQNGFPDDRIAQTRVFETLRRG